MKRIFPWAIAHFQCMVVSLKRHWISVCQPSWLLSILIVVLVLGLGSAPALAGLNDDHYDGNIFPLYAGNGSLVPPRVTLAESLRRDNPTLLVLYTNDSQDCKRYSSVISQLDAFYGRVSDFIPIDADSIPEQDTYAPSEPGYYYDGLVPKTVLFDKTGVVVLEGTGNLTFEQIDDKYRELFDLLPRSESVELKRRQVNEVNVELVPN